MLDDAILAQLRDVFAKLEKPVLLRYDRSDHAKQAELVALLDGVASVSERITAVPSDTMAPHPRFRIEIDGGPTGIAFAGIPGGHEFTSLVLAILNSNRLGKLPDEMILGRIARLKGPIRLRTIVSLSCENCPEVVQSLNLMAALHPDFEHEMVDGEFIPSDVARLGIQGVPSVLSGEKLLAAGKSGLLELLEKLEQEFGSTEASVEAVDRGLFDVVVVGGGPAGVSAAIYAARKGLATALLAERIGGQMQETKGIENFISVPYTEGPRLSADLARHVAEYKIALLENRRVAAVADGAPKRLTLTSGETASARALIIATGAKWRELGVPGEKDYIGRGVAFCPHCDGPYYAGKEIAVIGGGNSGVEAALDLAGIVKAITLIEFLPELKADAVLVEKLQALSNVTVIKNARTTEVVGDGSKVRTLAYEDRASGEIRHLALDGVFVQIGLVPNSAFIKEIVETNRFGEIVVDAKCRTSAKGIYAAGDVTTVPYKQIIIAMGEGAKAALTAAEELTLG
jgi:alkyl hydroperoxide reductase subunit F